MPESYRGQFLISAKQLRDPNFFKTVVLLLEHNQHGAMGLVVNRPSSVTVSQVLSEHFELPETGELVFMGGPVEPGNLFILHNADELDFSESPPLDGVFVGCTKDVFESVVQAVSEGDEDARFRVFSGCGLVTETIGRGDQSRRLAAARSLAGVRLPQRPVRGLGHADADVPESSSTAARSNRSSRMELKQVGLSSLTRTGRRRRSSMRSA